MANGTLAPSDHLIFIPTIILRNAEGVRFRVLAKDKDAPLSFQASVEQETATVRVGV
jgi:hypothetical protein